MNKKTILESPYKKAKKAGLKSKKKKININKNDYVFKQSEEIWDLNGPRDAFEAHPLSLKAQVYGSSEK